VPWSIASEAYWLRREQSFLTAREKSAEGIVGEGSPTAGTGNELRRKRGGLTPPKARTVSERN